MPGQLAGGATALAISLPRSVPTNTPPPAPSPWPTWHSASCASRCARTDPAAMARTSLASVCSDFSPRDAPPSSGPTRRHSAASRFSSSLVPSRPLNRPCMPCTRTASPAGGPPNSHAPPRAAHWPRNMPPKQAMPAAPKRSGGPAAREGSTHQGARCSSTHQGRHVSSPVQRRAWHPCQPSCASRRGRGAPSCPSRCRRPRPA